MKGIHLSPQSEFKKGLRPVNHVPIGTVKIRHRRRDDSRRAWVKIAEPNTWMLRAQLVWIATHGPIPAGQLIHHEDRDTLHDVLSNLTCLTNAEHLEEHRTEFER